MKPKTNLFDDLNILALYELGVPTLTISKLYNVSNTTAWGRLKSYEPLSLTKVRTRSATNLLTLSRRHTSPNGDDMERVSIWKKQIGVEGLKDLLAVFLLTDGSSSHSHKIIRLHNTDKVALGIFTDMLKEFGLNPRMTRDARTGVSTVFARANTVKALLNDIYCRTPVTKHQPARGKQNWEQYLIEKQPTLKFLKRSSMKTKELAFRLAISLEGCVTLANSKNKYSRPKLMLTCFHPILINEWQKIADEVGTHMYKSENRLSTVSFSPIANFLQIGGFIEGIKIGNNSKHFSGFEKNDMLLSICELYLLQREGKLKHSSNSNAELKNILQHHRFKEASFYIEYLLNARDEHNGAASQLKLIDALKRGPLKVREIRSQTGFKNERIYPIFRKLDGQGKLERVGRDIYSTKEKDINANCNSP
ncbi:MAG: hypothetical protein ABH829_05510 [archaeon]